MTRLIALAGLATYTVQSPIDHDGKRYPIGAPITLDTAEAQDLLDVEAIGHADKNATGALQATGDQAARISSLEQALDRAVAALQQANGQIEALTTQVAELRQAATNDQIAAAALAGDLRASLQTERAANGTLQAQLTAADGKAVDLQDKLTAADAKAADLQDKLTKAEAAKATGNKTK